MRSLEQMCLERVCWLLKKGTWNKCAKNPFSSLPVKTMDTLMTFLLSFPTFMTTRDMRLVFQSGQLSQLDLSTLLVDQEKNLLLRWMTDESCKNLRVLSVLHPVCDKHDASIVADILGRCRYLEEFHSKLAIDLSVLKNCHRLKILKLHLEEPFDALPEDLYLKIADFVHWIPNFEVFSFCNMKDGFSAHKAVAEIIMSCPKLLSVGLVDCLEALYHVRKTRGAMKLNLKRCLWGVDETNVPPSSKTKRSSPYSERYPDKVQNAIYMCPAVETLVMNVYSDEALEHLVHLNHLKSLSLKFHFRSANNATILTFLLRRIGPQLEHLSLDMKEPIPVEVIRDHCFNLKSFQMYGSLFMNDSMEDCYHPLLLERLYIWEADSKSLFLLLRRCSNLMELYLGKVLCLDNELMDKILMNNSQLSRLIVLGIMECLLTEDGIHKLLSSARNLKELFFGRIDPFKSAHKLISENNFKVLHYYDDFKLTKRDFYFFRPDPCYF